MENVFKKKDHSTFSWENLGDIKEGRENLGEGMPVLVYRLMQFTMLDVLTKDLGREKANGYLRAAGKLAGTEFARNSLDLTADLNTFVANLQKALEDLKVGILRIESIDDDAQNIVLTVAEDLDCSGLPITDETVCDYDEGFIAGILNEYTGKVYYVKEIDCWSSGDRVCRFKCTTEVQE
ncbi:MAG: 4-vinyl reductase [Treponema sp.]|jgi:predicted hydrocarbon binding protein|nr:4-vinyl reductase [Treponema sp.]